MQCDGTGRTARAERSESFHSIDSTSVDHRARALEAYPDQKVTLRAAQPCTEHSRQNTASAQQFASSALRYKLHTELTTREPWMWLDTLGYLSTTKRLGITYGGRVRTPIGLKEPPAGFVESSGPCTSRTIIHLDLLCKRYAQGMRGAPAQRPLPLFSPA